MSKTEQPVYALTSKFDGIVRIVQISRDVWGLTRMMKSLAKTYVCRKIGEDNYVDTLHDYKNTPVDKCPAGYVLKMIPPQSENQARRLDIYLSKQSGIVFTGYSVKTIGVYMIVSIDSIDEGIEIVNKNVASKQLSTNTHDTPFDMSAQRAWMESQPLILERFAEIQKRKQAEIKHEESTLMESVRIVETTDRESEEMVECVRFEESDDETDNETDEESDESSADPYIPMPSSSLEYPKVPSSPVIPKVPLTPAPVNLLKRAGSYIIDSSDTDDESSGSYEEPDTIIDFRSPNLRNELIKRVNILKQKTI